MVLFVVVIGMFIFVLYIFFCVRDKFVIVIWDCVVGIGVVIFGEFVIGWFGVGDFLLIN